MKYETVIRNIELSKTATIAQVEEVVDELLKDDEEYQTQNWDRLYSLLEDLLKKLVTDIEKTA